MRTTCRRLLVLVPLVVGLLGPVRALALGTDIPHAPPPGQALLPAPTTEGGLTVTATAARVRRQPALNFSVAGALSRGLAPPDLQPPKPGPKQYLSYWVAGAPVNVGNGLTRAMIQDRVQVILTRDPASYPYPVAVLPVVSVPFNGP